MNTAVKFLRTVHNEYTRPLFKALFDKWTVILGRGSQRSTREARLNFARLLLGGATCEFEL